MTRALVKQHGYLKNNSLFTTEAFPNTTDLWAWPNQGASDFDGNNLSGTSAPGLLEFGVGGGVTAGVNRFGDAVYNFFPPNDNGVYANSTGLDGYTGSFTVGMWAFLPSTTTTASRILAAKYDNGVVANRSFNWYVNVTNGMIFAVVYDASGNSVGLAVDNIRNEMYDKWHFFVAQYDQANTSLAIFMDGALVGYYYRSLLSAMNGGTNKLTFGASGEPIGGAASAYFGGRLEDMFFKKGTMTLDEIRKLYVYGSAARGFYEGTKIKIQGEINDPTVAPYQLPGAYFTSNVGGTLTLHHCYAIPYRDSTGSWRMKIHFAFGLAGAANNNYVGVILTGVNGPYTYEQAVAYRSNSGTLSGWIGGMFNASGGFTLGLTGGVQAINGEYQVYGDVALAAKPTWAASWL
jgi:hypothetical protein